MYLSVLSPFRGKEKYIKFADNYFQNNWLTSKKNTFEGYSLPFIFRVKGK